MKYFVTMFADCICTGSAGDSLGGSVKAGDPAVFIDREYTIRNRIQNYFEKP
jgi:hypothetical protein